MPTSPGPYSLRSPRLHCAWPAGHAHPCNIERATRRTIRVEPAQPGSAPEGSRAILSESGRKPSECGVAISDQPHAADGLPRGRWGLRRRLVMLDDYERNTLEEVE